MKQLMLMIGTRKGAFLAFSDPGRKTWEITGPIFKGVQVDHVAYAPDVGGAIVVTGTSAWWGPGLQISTDLGKTWQERSGIRFAEDRGHAVERVWMTTQGPTATGETVLYAGVAPAALFRSGDGGETWEEIRTLKDHDSRSKWTPGAGGLMVHSLCPHPTNPARLFVGISVAGAFRTDDGGETWTPKNRGVRADFQPEKFPEVGVCVHHMEMHPANPDILYQQNHCGVYRTENAGDDWIDISDGLPSRFGFPFAVLPHNGDTVYVCPAESDQYRLMTDGAFRIYRSRNRGDSWELLTQGLPQENAHQLVLRHAMATDRLDPAGVYVGTQGGQLLASRDEGDHWDVLFNWLPPITSVQTAIVDR